MDAQIEELEAGMAALQAEIDAIRRSYNETYFAALHQKYSGDDAMKKDYLNKYLGICESLRQAISKPSSEYWKLHGTKNELERRKRMEKPKLEIAIGKRVKIKLKETG